MKKPIDEDEDEGNHGCREEKSASCDDVSFRDRIESWLISSCSIDDAVGNLVCMTTGRKNCCWNALMQYQTLL
jgi:hypothetical protein